MKQKRIAVTGGAGMIGSHLVDELLRRDAEVLVIDNLSRGRLDNMPGEAHLLQADLSRRDSVRGAFAGVDTVFHLAGPRLPLCQAEPRLALEAIAQATHNVLEEAVQAGVRKLVFASSSTVYGTASQLPAQESQPLGTCQTFYAAAKLYGEALMAAFQARYGLETLSLRYFHVYGPRMDRDSPQREVLVRWMERIEAGRPPLIFGDGSQTSDFVYVEDIARGTVDAALAAPAGAILNLASGIETSLTQLATTLVEVMGSSLPVEYQDAPPPTVARLCGDPGRAGFQARVGLREGLQRLVSWWRT